MKAAFRQSRLVFLIGQSSEKVKPSDADKQLHERLTSAAEILGLRILDHVIISRKGYFSFQEQGLLRVSISNLKQINLVKKQDNLLSKLLILRSWVR